MCPAYTDYNDTISASPKRICVVTGSRADYAYLRPVMRLLAADPAFTLQLAVTGMHLWTAFGASWKEIVDDGFDIDARVEVPFKSTDAIDIARMVGDGVGAFAEVFKKLKPDFLLILGDRYEVFAAAQAALFLRLPIGHLAGGDTSQGAYDEAIRHAITKMAHIHFVTNPVSARRVAQLGEDPHNIFNVGATCLDSITEIPRLSRETLEKDLSFRFARRNILVTFHPTTLSDTPESVQIEALLGALEDIGAGKELSVVITAPGADTDGLVILDSLKQWAASRDGVLIRESLGLKRYYSILAVVDAVVGNSSSGIYEVPSFGIPSVDIGERQRGRMLPDSVIHCPVEREAIHAAIAEALELDCTGVVNPYGDGGASVRILEVLRRIDDVRALLMKRFFDVNGGNDQ